MVITITACLVNVSSHKHFSIEYNSDISSTGTGGDVAIANLDCSTIALRGLHIFIAVNTLIEDISLQHDYNYVVSVNAIDHIQNSPLP